MGKVQFKLFDKQLIFMLFQNINDWIVERNIGPVMAYMVRFHEDAYWPNLMPLFTACSEHY